MDVSFAKRLLQKHGQTVDLVRYVDAIPLDLAKPWRVNSTTSIVQTCPAVFVSAHRTKTGLPTDSQMSDGIPRAEEKVLLAASGLTSEPNLKCEIRDSNGERWIVSSIVKIAPAGKAILYSLQVRQ